MPQLHDWNAGSPILKRGIALCPVKFGISFTLTHLNQAGALVHVYQDGSIQLNHGGTEMGQGLFQKVAQVAASRFGVDMDARHASLATDTGKVPNTSATAASSGTDLNGMAVQAACDTIRERLAVFHAERAGVTANDVQFERQPSHRRRSRMTFAEAVHAGLSGACEPIVDRVLADARRRMGPDRRTRPTVFLFCLWSRNQRGRGRHAYWRKPHFAHRYFA